MNDRILQQAMDMCRPGSGDLQLPELRELARRINEDPAAHDALQRRQQLDQQLADRIRTVRLSDDRRLRLLQSAQAVRSATRQTKAARARVRQRARRRRRRLVLSAGGLVALSIMLLIAAGWNLLNPWRTLSPRRLAHLAVYSWAEKPQEWRPMGHLSPEHRQKIARFLRVSPIRWQIIETSLDRDTLVVDLTAQSPLAKLFILDAHRRARLLPTRPPSQPQTRYERQYFAAWQDDTSVFVLSMSGSLAQYRDVVQTRGHSLATREETSETVR